MQKTRVTDIISSVFLFNKTQFVNSLSPSGIKKKLEKGLLIEGGEAMRLGQLDYDLVMDRLSTFGSEIHLLFTDSIINLFPHNKGPLYEPFMKGINDFIKLYSPEVIDYNLTVEGDDFVGTLDVILKVGSEIWLCDIKTYQAYKYLYGIKDDILSKKGEAKLTSSDKKKVIAQCSIYEQGLKCMNYKHKITHRKLLWTTQYGLFVFDLPFDLDVYYTWQDKKINNSIFGTAKWLLNYKKENDKI